MLLAPRSLMAVYENHGYLHFDYCDTVITVFIKHWQFHKAQVVGNKVQYTTEVYFVESKVIMGQQRLTL